MLQAPRDLFHNQAFNVGRTEENYRIREVAELVREVVPGSEVTFAEGAPRPALLPGRLRQAAGLPGVELRWTVRQGVEQLYAAFKEHGWTRPTSAVAVPADRPDRALLEAGRLGPDLRWQAPDLRSTTLPTYRDTDRGGSEDRAGSLDCGCGQEPGPHRPAETLAPDRGALPSGPA